MAKRKPYTRQNVPPPSKSSATRYKGQAVSKRKTRKTNLKNQAKTFQRDSGKAKTTSSSYDVTDQFNKYKKDRLKVKTKSTKVKPKIKGKAKSVKSAKNPFDKRKAPKVDKFKKLKKKSWLQKTMEKGAKRGQKLKEDRAIRDFNRQVKKTRTPTGQQFQSKTRLPSDDLSKKARNAAKGTRALQKGTGIGKHIKGLKHAKGLAKGGAQLGIGLAADWGTDQVFDRIDRQITGNSKMSLKDFRAKKKAWEKENVTWWGGVKKGAPKNFKAKDTESTSSSTGKTNKSESNKSSKGTSKKKFTARDRMRAKNVEIHGEEAIKKLEKSHKDWKAARKAGTLKTRRKKKTRPDTWRDVE